MVNGQVMKYNFYCECDLKFKGYSFYLNCIISRMLPDYDLILGMDAIETLGGDLRVRNGEATFYVFDV